MSMLVQVSAEVLRIAYAFQANMRFGTIESERLWSVAAYVLAVPNTEAGGINVFSTDGTAICVQRDPTGTATGPCLIIEIGAIKPHLSDQQINRRYVVAKEDSIRVIEDCGQADVLCEVKGQTVLRKADVHQNAGPTNPLALPDWPSVLARIIDGGDWAALDSMPVRHMAILGGLWDTWPDARTVELARDCKQGYTLAMFPFRPKLMVMIADKRHPEFDILAGAHEVLEPEDPAAGL